MNESNFPTRRRFLKQSTLAGVAVLASPHAIRAANLESVAFAAEFGGEDDNDRTGLVIEKLNHPAPRDVGFE